jgi:hypothetical protein
LFETTKATITSCLSAKYIAIFSALGPDPDAKTAIFFIYFLSYNAHGKKKCAVFLLFFTLLYAL